MIDPDGYRPNVGIVLMRPDGRVFWARRVRRDGWQFPQGGMNTDETPVEAMDAVQLAGKKLVLAPILRAGVGLLDGMLDLIPAARVAHIGLYRDPETLVAVEYYFKAPEDIAERMVIVIDPMLATANTAVAAMERLKERGVTDLRFVCLVASPEGIERLKAYHPDVPVWTAAIDKGLNDHGYIVPGLGDAGDRLFGTR